MRLAFSAALVLALVLGTPLIASTQTLDELQKSIGSARDGPTAAKLNKQLGDAWVAQDNLEQAAEAYLQALAAGREHFSSSERLRMAIYLSWADRLKDSEAELRHLLTEDPKNVAARTHLARVLSWSGELNGAIREAEMALRQAPDHKEALLVRADALQWQGRYLDAIPIYRSVVARDGDFDARVGLARSLLAVGDRNGAEENLRLLNPANARQKRDFARLREDLDRETSPWIEARYNYANDSDKNRLHRYLLTGGFWAGNQRYSLDYRHTDARDRTRDNRAEDILFKVYSRLTDRLSGGAGLGFAQLADGHSSNFPAGHVRLDAKLFAGSAGVNVTREVLTDTAEIIQNRIRMTHAGMYITQPLTERFSVRGAYQYKDFSDGNHANDLQLVSQYSVYLAPRINIGHRFRLLDFDKQSGGGYFDPNNYIANRAFASLYYEQRFLYVYLDGFVGYETFRRNRIASDNFIYGGTGSLGVKPTPHLAIELNVEGGQFSAGSASGFNYFNIGPRLTYKF